MHGALGFAHKRAMQRKGARAAAGGMRARATPYAARTPIFRARDLSGSRDPGVRDS